MTYVYDISLVLCGIYIIIQVFYLFLLSRYKKQKLVTLPEYPTISILVAARNEADNIVRCLESLDRLEYDQGKIEILIGNDSSSDYTQMLTDAFIRDKPKFRLINLTGKEYPSTKGKARVLATLAAASTGEYLLITDADIAVGPLWAKGLVSQMVSNNCSMAGGTTNIVAYDLFSKFQHVDWLYFMGIINTFASVGTPLTVVGNNMAFSRAAYLETGGYENIPFSITEDYALFKILINKGHKISQAMNAETLVYSQPIDTLKGVLKQRKRWLVGGLDLPLHYKAMIFVFGAWYLCLPILFIFDWRIALNFLIIKDLIQLFQIIIINRHLKLNIEHPIAVMIYDVYLFIMIPFTVFYFFWPGNTTWKGRKY
jgi:cellulose synthase/poly-beta-1,6-N-acetylglucosamine synthase-like glycosyltransferase